MKDSDDARGERSHRDWRSAGSARRSRAGSDGFERLFERLLSDVSSWFDDDGRGGRRPGRQADGPRARPGARAQEGGGESGDVATGGGAPDEAPAPPSPSMRGKGPKNYRRSDARIGELVNDALLDDERLDATDIEVSVADGDVALAGRVASRGDKHRAENLAARVSGVDDVDNRLRVRREGSTPSSHPGGLPGDAQQDADDYGHP